MSQGDRPRIASSQIAIGLVMLVALGCASHPTKEGKAMPLAPCPNKPNCVSSLAPDDDHRVAPYAISGGAKGWAAVRDAVDRRAMLEAVVTAEPSAPDKLAEPAASGQLDEIDEPVIAKVSDYLDRALPAAEHAEVARRIADDPAWKRAHAELSETRTFLSGLRKAHAPASFAQDVAETIHQRSAGRLFARRTLGDRVPFRALLAVALAGLIAIGYILWSSSTGSLKRDRDPSPPPAGSAVDRP